MARSQTPSALQCVAVCCSVLQCVEVCCSVLQCVAVCCSVMQCDAVCCSVLQCVAVCCSVLRCVAVCCSVLQCVAARTQSLTQSEVKLLHPCCALLCPCCVFAAVFDCLIAPSEKTAIHCNTLQHTATHCITLQHCLIAPSEKLRLSHLCRSILPHVSRPSCNSSSARSRPDVTQKRRKPGKVDLWYTYSWHFRLTTVSVVRSRVV